MIVIGAAPSIANGFIAGVDNTPPILVRAGRMLGAKGWTDFRHVVLPAALPTYVGGLKQGWAFAWRSLLAGELLVQIAGKESLGRDLDTARQFADYQGLYATMIVILVIGILVDSLIFGQVERRIRKRYGLIDAAGRRLIACRYGRSRSSTVTERMTSPTLTFCRDVHALDDVAEEVVVLRQLALCSRRS